MPAGRSETTIRDIDRLFGVGTVAGMTDAQLLERFVATRDEHAFAALVARHGPMVLGVCRGVLKDENHAEDAFQAAFLVLVRKAPSLRVEKSLASWLYRVSFRIAVQADADVRRRLRRERQFATLRANRDAERPESNLGPLLFEEIDRLPEKYRVPVVLSGLEGMTHEAVAQRLGCPIGTVSGRLSRARELLRTRLTRRGATLTSGFMAAGTSAKSASAIVPSALVASTVAAARRVLAHGVVSGSVSRLVEGAIKSMLISQLKVTALALIAVGTTAVGLAAFAQQAGTDPQPTPAPAPGPERAAQKSAAAPVAARTSAPAATRILKDAALAVEIAEDRPIRVFALIAIAKAQAEVGEREAALASLRDAVATADKLRPQDRGNALTAVAYAHWDAGDRSTIPAILQRAREAADEVDGDSQQLSALQSVGMAQAWAGEIEAAGETLKRMNQIVEAPPRNFGRYLNTMSIVELQAAMGDFDGALLVVDTFTSDIEKGGLLGRIAESASSATHHAMQTPRELTRAEKVERREFLHRIMKTYRDLPADVAIALGDLGETDEALKIVRELHQGQVRQGQGDPTALPYFLMRIGLAQAKSGQPDAARKTFQDALSLIRGHSELASRLDQVAYGQAESGDIEAALKTVEMIKPAGRGSSLIHIAELQAKGGDTAAAKATLRTALENAKAALANPAPVKPGTLGADPTFRKSWSLIEIGKVQAKLGDFDLALESAREVLPKWRGEVLREIAKEQALAGSPQQVLKWATQLDQPDDKAIALAGLAEGIRLAKKAEATAPARE